MTFKLVPISIRCFNRAQRHLSILIFLNIQSELFQLLINKLREALRSYRNVNKHYIYRLNKTTFWNFLQTRNLWTLHFIEFRTRHEMHSDEINNSFQMHSCIGYELEMTIKIRIYQLRESFGNVSNIINYNYPFII